jgi:electron transfer flavoprotein alpha subunit
VAGVLVYIETAEGRPAAASLDALGEGRRIASTLGATLYACAASSRSIGNGRDELAAILGRGGADKVVVVPVAASGGPAIWATQGAAVAAACEQLRPALVLLAATGAGRDIGPRLAARMGGAYFAEPAIERGPRGEIVLSRPIYGASHRRRLAVEDLGHPVIATLTPGAFAPATGIDDADILVLEAVPSGSPDEGSVRWLDAGDDPGKALDDARVIVVAGGGVTAATWPLLGELASALGAVLGATRELCERGIAPAHLEIGVGARRVKPQLYVVCGASGSGGHIGALWSDAEIIAIDRDPEAPIFKVASYGIVGEIERVVPELIEALRGRPRAAVTG